MVLSWQVAPLLQSPLDTSVASSTTTSEEDTSSGTSPFAATEAGNSSTAVAGEKMELHHTRGRHRSQSCLILMDAPLTPRVRSVSHS